MNNLGKTVIVVRAMYGLKSSGVAWHAKFSETLRSMDFKPSYAHPDVWMKPATTPDGFKYYEYILVYVDDLLIISHQAMLIVNTLKSQYRLKEDEVGKPKTYLGAHVKESRLPEDCNKRQWGLSAEQYIQNAIKNIEDKLNESGKTLLSKKYASTQY